jgi:hypothetical protein
MERPKFIANGKVKSANCKMGNIKRRRKEPGAWRKAQGDKSVAGCKLRVTG